MAAAALWSAAFLLCLAAANHTAGRSTFDSAGLLSAYPIVFFILVAGTKLLDLLHRLDTPGMFGLHLAILGGAAVVLHRASVRPRETATGRTAGAPAEAAADSDDGTLIRRIAVATVVITAAALALFSLIAPVHIWDVQAYHMPMVASYVQNESLAAWPAQDLRQIYRVNAAEIQILALALLARSDAWVELPNVLAFVVGFFATFHLARLVLARESLAWAAAILVVTAPQILLGSVTAKNDIIFMALVLCAFYWTIRIAAEPEGRTYSRIGMLALVAALCVGTKVMGLNVVGAVGLVLLLLAIRRRVPLASPFLFGALAALGTAVLVGDIYWRNLSSPAAVPVGTTPGEIWFTSGIANVVAAARFYLYDLSFRRLVTPQIIEHDFSHFGYFFPLVLVLGSYAACRALLMRTEGRRAPVSLALLVLFLFGSIIAVRQPIGWDQRFMIWMVPSFAILAGLLVRGVRPRKLLVIASFGAAFGMANLLRTVTDASGGLFPRSARYLAFQGQLASLRDVPQTKYIAKIDGYDVLDRSASPADSILYVGWEDTWMYPAWGRRFTRYVSGVSDADDAERRLATGTYRFVVVEDDATPELKRRVLDGSEAAGYGYLVRAHGRRILERGSGAPRAESDR